MKKIPEGNEWLEGRRLPQWAVAVLISLLVFFLLGLWSYAASGNEFLWASPRLVLEYMIRFWADIWASWRATIWNFVSSYFLGVSAGLLLGIALGMSQKLAAVFAPIMYMMASMSRTALIFLVVLVFGYKHLSIVIFAVLVTMFVVASFYYDSVRETFQTRPTLSMDYRSRVGLLKWHIWETTREARYSALRAGVLILWPALVLPELFVFRNKPGLGALMGRSFAEFRIEGVIAAALLITLSAKLTVTILTRLENRPRRPGNVI